MLQLDNWRLVNKHGESVVYSPEKPCFLIGQDNGRGNHRRYDQVPVHTDVLIEFDLVKGLAQTHNNQIVLGQMLKSYGKFLKRADKNGS